MRPTHATNAGQSASPEPRRSRMIDRRGFTLGTGAALAGLALPEAAGATSETLDFARIEAESGGRLGVAVLDTRDGRRAGHRADERFALCSTFKLLAGAAVL